MKKPKMLIIDDDMSILESYSLFLGEQFDIDTSETVDNAINMMNSKDYDVIIIDMAFPQNDNHGGLRVIKHVYDTKIKSKIIVLTAFGSIENIRQCHEFNIFDYIEKGTSHTRDSILTSALKAIKEPEKMTIILSEENKKIISTLEMDLNTNSIGVLREGIRILNWAVSEWKEGCRIISEKKNKIKVYPKRIS